MVLRVLENLQTPCHRTCYQHIHYIGRCNIGIYKDMSIHIHIFTGASLQFLLQIFVQVCLCTLFCRCAVTSSTECYRNLQMSTANCFGNAGLGLSPYGLVQSNLVWHSHFDTGYANLRQRHI